MGTFIKIGGDSIKNALKGVRRQYLVGNLKLPQTLKHIPSLDLEIGISSYSLYMEELPHKHSVATEYQYVICGWTKYIDTETMQEYEFKSGDFYAILPETSYAQKCKAGTQILFIKAPSINDKIIVDVAENIQQWFKSNLKTIRKDFFHEENMPIANSIRPAAAVAIIKDNCILMLKRKDNSKWTLPSGTMEYNESLTDCALREVKEETNLDVQITDIIGTYTDPDIRIEYSDGEVRREFTVVYLGITNSNSVKIDSESSAYKWISINSVLDLNMALSQRKRIQDVLEFIQYGKKYLK